MVIVITYRRDAHPSNMQTSGYWTNPSNAKLPMEPW